MRFAALIIGALMFGALFGGLFVLAAKDAGWKVAAAIYGVTLAVAAFIMAAAFLVTYGVSGGGR